jgi:hypothetical protein
MDQLQAARILLAYTSRQPRRCAREHVIGVAIRTTTNDRKCDNGSVV